MERTILDDIIEQWPEASFLKADGYDDCILGYEYDYNGNMRLIYSVKAILNKMVTEDEMSEEDAIEHFEFNMRGGYVGEQTPIWCQDDF
jgi:hypothetical protein